MKTLILKNKTILKECFNKIFKIDLLRQRLFKWKKSINQKLKKNLFNINIIYKIVINQCKWKVKK